MLFTSVNIAILLVILPATLQQQLTEKQLQTKFIFNITAALHNLYKFDNFISYRIARPHQNHAYISKSWNDFRPRVNFARIMHQNIFVPIMTFAFDTRLDMNDTALIPNLGPILTNQNLALVILPEFFNDKLMNFVSISLGASLETKIVFVYTGIGLLELSVQNRKKKLIEFFLWCWSKNILSAVLVVKIARSQNMDVYTYTPFPKPIKLLHLKSQNASQFFTEKTENLMGYEFKTPVYQDKPLVFKTIDKKTGKEIITGTAGRLYLEFVKKINATFVEIHRPDTKTFHDRHFNQIDQLKKGEIDIGIHPYSYLIPLNVSGSFPITHTNSCVVVPVRPEINRACYIPQTFTAIIWKLLMLIFVLFFVLQMASNYRRYSQLEASVAFIVTLSGMLNLPSSFMKHHCRSQAKNFFGNEIAACIKILLMTTGLLFTHTHMAALTSLLSTTIYGRQMETLEDLRSENVTIMLLDQMALVFKYLDVFPPSFDTNLLITDTDTIAQHQFQLNNTYSYIVYREEWKVLRRLQTNLWKPVFRVASKLCIPNLFLTFPMQYKSPFYKRLKRFTLWTQATGLDNKWSDKVFSEIQQEWRTVLRWRIHPVSITNTHLIVAWYTWILGLLLASIVFCAEFLSKQKNFRSRKREEILNHLKISKPSS